MLTASEAQQVQALRSSIDNQNTKQSADSSSNQENQGNAQLLNHPSLDASLEVLKKTKKENTPHLHLHVKERQETKEKK